MAIILDSFSDPRWEEPTYDEMPHICPACEPDFEWQHTDCTAGPCSEHGWDGADDWDDCLREMVGSGAAMDSEALWQWARDAGREHARAEKAIKDAQALDAFRDRVKALAAQNSNLQFQVGGLQFELRLAQEELRILRALNASPR